jgi:hypothetical protein
MDEKIAGLDKMFEDKLVKEREVGKKTDEKL